MVPKSLISGKSVGEVFKIKETFDFKFADKVLFFRGFLGPQTAFDYPMRDFTWFWVVLGKKWGFLKFSDF